MAAPRALLFDVFGTLVDWRSGLLAACAEVAGRSGAAADWPAVVDDWRRAYCPGAGGRPRRRLPGATSTRCSATRSPTSSPGTASTLPDDDREVLVRSWRRLPAWPDAPAGTRPAAHRLGARHAVQRARRAAGRPAALRRAAHGHRALRRARRQLQARPGGLPARRRAARAAPREVGMVAAHPGDLEAAAESGCGRCSSPGPASGGRARTSPRPRTCRVWSSRTTSTISPTSSRGEVRRRICGRR